MEKRWHYLRFTAVGLALAFTAVWAYWIGRAFLEALPEQRQITLDLDRRLHTP